MGGPRMVREIRRTLGRAVDSMPPNCSRSIPNRAMRIKLDQGQSGFLEAEEAGSGSGGSEASSGRRRSRLLRPSRAGTKRLIATAICVVRRHGQSALRQAPPTRGSLRICALRGRLGRRGRADAPQSWADSWGCSCSSSRGRSPAPAAKNWWSGRCRAARARHVGHLLEGEANVAAVRPGRCLGAPQLQPGRAVLCTIRPKRWRSRDVSRGNKVRATSGNEASTPTAVESSAPVMKERLPM